MNIFTALGDHFGAGVAGKGFALALAEKVDVRLAIFPDVSALTACVAAPAEVAALRALAARPVSEELPSFVRGALARRWSCPAAWPRRHSARPPTAAQHAPFIAHINFEHDRLAPAELAWLQAADLVTTGSDWTTAILRKHGMDNVATVHQGVELDVFRPDPAADARRPPELAGKFLVFTGGKFEYRKGCDLAIAAFARFRERYANAVLVINAYNPWPATQAGLRHSPHFNFTPLRNYRRDLEGLLHANGIPADSCRVLGPSPRPALAAAMAMCDCGLFPVRCEGGTNHFLMEFMACGRPVLATYTTGLTDILRPDRNCIALGAVRPVPVTFVRPEPDRGTWHEPVVEEIVAALETLYQSPATGTRLAEAALDDIQRFGWSCRADHLLAVVAALRA